MLRLYSVFFVLTNPYLRIHIATSLAPKLFQRFLTPSLLQNRYLFAFSYVANRSLSENSSELMAAVDCTYIYLLKSNYTCLLLL
jgi:hypothetical protein